MNDDDAASSSTAAPPSTSPAAHESATYMNDAAPGEDSPAEEERVKIQSKKADNLRDLVRNLDLLIYTQLAVVYYMDTSLLRFILRALMQLIYLTPKPPLVPIPPNSKDRPYVSAVFGTNILCLILHLWLSRPSAGEATRGYLHGGLLIDFIGQKGPTSKFHLVLLDLSIPLLQMIMLAVLLEEKKSEARKRSRSWRQAGTSAGGEASAVERTDALPNTQALSSQDLDAEERGTRRSLESASLLNADVDVPAASGELLDRLRSGQAMTAKFYIWDTVRDDWRAYSDAVRMATMPDQPDAGGPDSGLAAALARSSNAARLGLRRARSPW